MYWPPAMLPYSLHWTGLVNKVKVLVLAVFFRKQTHYVKTFYYYVKTDSDCVFGQIWWNFFKSSVFDWKIVL